MVETLLFGAIALVAYTYVGYPMLALVLARFRARPVRKADITPTVSVIIAAYNEERDIALKLENTFALDYEPGRLEIIVASDCSSDGTDSIVRGFADRGVVLCRQSERHGKTAVQNAAVKVATGEILLFSDATTLYGSDVVRKLVRNFADESVGCVTGRMVYVDPDSTAVGRGTQSYWDYELLLKSCESTFGSLIGVHGPMYAVRRSAYRDIAADMSSDFVQASEVHLQGLRAVYEPEALSTEETNVCARDEYRARVRMIEQTMRALYRYRAVLNPLRHGLYAVEMISHKLLRYAVPVWLLVAFVASAALATGSVVYRVAFLLQAAFYGVALVGGAMERGGLKLGPLAIPYYFVLGNLASLWALVMFVRGQRQVVWEPIRPVDGAFPDRGFAAAALEERGE